MRALSPSLLGLAVALALTLPVGGSSASAWATGKAKDSTSASAKKKRDPRLAMITAKGRPTIKLDRLDFPEGIANSKHYKLFLKKRLLREAKRAKWGAGRNNVIEFRFAVKHLEITVDEDVIRVSCLAVGQLPKGKLAKSKLSYGGNPRKTRQVVENVLAIVARGVVSRLAEMERIRRGDLSHSHVRAPTVSD
jgi:hypothetical protein